MMAGISPSPASISLSSQCSTVISSESRPWHRLAAASSAFAQWGLSRCKSWFASREKWFRSLSMVMFGPFARLKKKRADWERPPHAIKRPVRKGDCADWQGKASHSGGHRGWLTGLQTTGNQERSFQVSLWMMLPSLYDHVIV